jgi:hypothetical protein
MEHLEAAYHATTYRVFSPPIEIRTGAASNALDQLLEQYSAVEWAFISAWNPMSQQQTPAENETAHQQLLEAVAAFLILKAQASGMMDYGHLSAAC